MNFFDWFIVLIYLAGMIGLSVYLARGQKDLKDYYLAGNTTKWWQISLSTMATQCSTNSLLGAPAFVGFAALGGLVWLQYELAVPLAMIFIMIFLFPFYRRAGVVSIYEYLELRFGPATRTVLSLLFQFLRAFSTGITVYGISLVISKVISQPLWVSVALIFFVTIVYDSIGGMKGVIISDVIQMFVLVIGIVVIGIYALVDVGGMAEVLNHVDPHRLKTLDFSSHGLGDGGKFSFWPMLVGGFFLYVSYYGCDQTQVQRELSSQNIDDSRRSLFLNGVLRFPLVLMYCFLGIAIAAFAAKNPNFLTALPTENGVPNNNMVVPVFVFQYLPHGIIGLIVVALFSAAMSSLDSTINSLSATSMKDFYQRFINSNLTPGEELKWSKFFTLFWGLFCTICVYFVGAGESIIAQINKMGSLINGPILGTFVLAIFTKRAVDKAVVTGILLGFFVNLALMNFAPGFSFFWWNPIGFGVTFSVGYVMSFLFAPPAPEKLKDLTLDKSTLGMALGDRKWYKVYWGLGGYFVFILAVLFAINSLS